MSKIKQTNEHSVRQSKFLSLVLRHEPEKIGITLDAQGWVDVSVLLNALEIHRQPMSRDELARLVAESEKKRFALSEDGLRIRANQGHSVEVDLALEPKTPPELLFHGTPDRFIESIRKTGIEKRERHHVHLTESRTVAHETAQRRGRPVVLEIRAGEMSRTGSLFYLTDNNVWLVDGVPPKFIINSP